MVGHRRCCWGCPGVAGLPLCLLTRPPLLRKPRPCQNNSRCRFRPFHCFALARGRGGDAPFAHSAVFSPSPLFCTHCRKKAPRRIPGIALPVDLSPTQRDPVPCGSPSSVGPSFSGSNRSKTSGWMRPTVLPFILLLCYLLLSPTCLHRLFHGLATLSPTRAPRALAESIFCALPLSRSWRFGYQLRLRAVFLQYALAHLASPNNCARYLVIVRRWGWVPCRGGHGGLGDQIQLAMGSESHASSHKRAEIR